MDDIMEVYFNIYCLQCKHEKVKDWEEPCATCLAYPGRLNSHTPEKFEKKETET